MEKVYTTQTNHFLRLIHKQSNKKMNALPVYLDSHKYVDESLPRKHAKQILANTYDYKPGDEKLSEAIKYNQRFRTIGSGPLTKKEMQGMPPELEYIYHLMERFDMKYDFPKPEDEEDLDQETPPQPLPHPVNPNVSA